MENTKHSTHLERLLGLTLTLLIVITLGARTEAQNNPPCSKDCHGCRAFDPEAQYPGCLSPAVEMQLQVLNFSTAKLSKAVAAYWFHPSGSPEPPSIKCTGALINNTKVDRRPLFLTAYHCIPKSVLHNVAGTLQAQQPSGYEAFWDYVLPATLCPNKSQLREEDPSLMTTKTEGATLLYADPSTDVALLELLQFPGDPADRTFLGWTNSRPQKGAPLFRLSHPYGLPQVLTLHTVVSSMSDRICSEDVKPTSFLTSSTNNFIGEASSGAPLVNAELQVQGQYWGCCCCPLCEPASNIEINFDGAFADSFPHLKQWLDPGNTGATSLPALLPQPP